MYDYVLVGAGSAGCVLANRLSGGGKTVLLLEAGPHDRDLMVKIPAGISQLINDPVRNWRFSTEPEPHLDNRRLYWPRGKTLGGSSSINGMIYIRGQPEDYEGWKAQGNTGWGWADVLPYFKRSEHNESGADPWHGGDGELFVSGPRFRHPSSEAFIEAAVASGIPLARDFNGARQEGAGFYQFTIRDGMRCSTSQAFLARAGSNLRIETDSQVQRINFEGSRASGVTYRARAGDVVEMRGREIVLCAGAIGSPQLLMVSGVGPAADLKRLGIPVVHDLPGVGLNLHDHLYIHHYSEVAPECSINRAMQGWRLLPAIVDYGLRRRGLLTLAASQAAAFVRSDETLSRPDLQLMFKPYTLEARNGKIMPTKTAGLSTLVSPLRPKSRGWLRLASADPAAAPLMCANYLAEAADREAMVAGLKIIRRVFSHAPLDDIARESAPGPDIVSDEALDAFVRANAQSMYHPVGSCKMGNDPMAVVDDRLRVHGIANLRVVDASIMPDIVSGNTNAATIMIAEKAADFLRGVA